MVALSRQNALQLARFVIVGVLNTLVTLVVIFVAKSVLAINPWVANALGYAAGIINSFFWSRNWVFQSRDGKLSRQAVAFMIGAAVCYTFQLFVTWSLTDLTPLGEVLIPTPLITLSGYGIATLVGNVTYTLTFFCYNRMVAFKTTATASACH